MAPKSHASVFLDLIFEKFSRMSPLARYRMFFVWNAAIEPTQAKNGAWTLQRDRLGPRSYVVKIGLFRIEDRAGNNLATKYFLKQQLEK